MSATTRTVTCLTLALSAGLACAQPGTGSYIGGFLHQPIGGAVVTPTGDREFRVSNIGSSGQDGVSVQLNTLGGLSCDVAMGPVLSTPGARVKTIYKGWDGGVKGGLECVSSGGGSCDVMCDFSMLGPAGSGVSSLHWILRDSIGTVLAEGDAQGSTSSCVVTDTSFVGAPPLSPPTPTWTISGHCTKGNHIHSATITCRREVTVSGLTSTPIPHVGSIEFRTIVCITSPCPGDWTNMSAMEVTAANTPGGQLSAGKVSYSDLSVMISLEKASVKCHGLGQAHLEEFCDMPPPVACAPTERKLVVSNIGSSGNDGVSWDFTSAESFDSSDVMHRDLAARSVRVAVRGSGGGGGGSGGSGGMEMRFGHSSDASAGGSSTKIGVQSDPLSGGALYRCDATGRGSPECLAECLSDTGAVLGSAVVSSVDSITVFGSAGGGDISYVGTCDAQGRPAIECASPLSLCILPNGTVAAGVARVAYSPIKPTRPPGFIAQCDVTCTDLAEMVIDSMTYERGELAGGLMHAPVGGAALSPASDGSIIVSNIGSSGNDGVSVDLGAHGGGMTLDLAPLIGPFPPHRVYTVRPKGWDGDFRGMVELSNSAAGGISETYDLSSMGVTGMTWRLLGDAGVVLAEGASVGPVLSWTFAPENAASGGPDKVFEIAPAAAGRRANQGFFDVAMVVSGLTTTPVLGVHSMEITPDPCAGLPENCPPSWANIASMQVTAQGIPECVVSGSHLSVQFENDIGPGISCRGVGKAKVILRESPTLRSLACSNIGSSGNDGVRLELGGHNAGGVQLSVAKEKCCPGHVTLLKLTDDAGQEQRISQTTIDPVSGDEQISADFSALGASGFVLTCYGVGGVVVGPPGGTAIFNGGPRPIFTNRCPNGGTEKWINVGTAGNPVWQFQGCEFNNNMTLPGGTVLTGVASYTISPLNQTTPAAAKIRHVVITKNGSELELRGVVITPPAPTCGTPDFDGDGDYGTDADIESFFACLGGTCCTTCFSGGSDFNADGDYGTDADIESFFRVLGGGPC